MLAGRKLLLADDSATIQKVIDLTFTDEGVHVVSVNTCDEAVQKLDAVSPDIVLADVFMPGMTGYELCDYIKRSEKLRHIPVMLLVGSFEPFDEEEARRVGADAIVSKPFQSIRGLIDKVSGLLGGRQGEGEETAELLKEGPPAEKIDQLRQTGWNLSAADTTPLTDEAHSMDYQPQTSRQDAVGTHSAGDLTTRTPTDSDESLLDLGDLEPTPGVTGDSILDLELEPPVFAAPAPAETHPYVKAAESQYEPVREYQVVTGATAAVASAVGAGVAGASRQEAEQTAVPVKGAIDYGVVEIATPGASSGQIRLEQLSPEVIEAIARRAVEQLSERVVEDIAWEVVPHLAELMIARQLDEGKSQPK